MIPISNEYVDNVFKGEITYVYVNRLMCVYMCVHVCMYMRVHMRACVCACE